MCKTQECNTREPENHLTVISWQWFHWICTLFQPIFPSVKVSADPWFLDLLLTSPHINPDLVTSALKKQYLAHRQKFLLFFSFLHSNGVREFYFSRSSFHTINELNQHLLSGASHQKKQFSSSLKTSNKTWLVQGFCCLWNTQILAIAQCKLKADLAKGGDEISLLIFWSKYQNAFEW